MNDDLPKVSTKTYKLIKKDDYARYFENGSWITDHDSRLVERYPDKFSLDYNKKTKQITLRFNPINPNGES